MQPEPIRDTKSSLYEAAVAAVKSREEVQAARALLRPWSQRRRGWHAGLLLIGLTGAVLLLLRPDWLAGPRAIPSEPPAIAAASLRLSLLRERQRVVSFERAHAHLPATLGEAGSDRADLGYQSLGPDAFRLWGSAGDSLITLRSSDSSETFLGASLRLLRHRGRR